MVFVGEVMCVDPFFFSTTRNNRERSGHTRSCYIRQATYPRKGRTMDRNVFAFVIFFSLSLPLSYHVMLWLIGRHVYDYDSGIRPILFFFTTSAVWCVESPPSRSRYGQRCTNAEDKRVDKRLPRRWCNFL